MTTVLKLDVPQLVLEAHSRCQEYLSPTPLEYSNYLSEQIEGEVWLKLDLMQKTSSFTFRGAINKILTLTEAELDKGVVSASTGNYALAVAEAMRIRKRRATIYVAEDIESSRLELLRSHGLDLVVFGELAWDAEKEARRVAEEEDKIYVSPYNDPIVVGGSMRTNKMVEMETFTTLAGHLRRRRRSGQHHSGAVSAVCGGDRLALRKRDRSIHSILFEQHRLVAEGSGALGVGGLLKRKERLKGKKVVAVICGRNIDLEVFKRIIA